MALRIAVGCLAAVIAASPPASTGDDPVEEARYFVAQHSGTLEEAKPLVQAVNVLAAYKKCRDESGRAACTHLESPARASLARLTGDEMTTAPLAVQVVAFSMVRSLAGEFEMEKYRGVVRAMPAEGPKDAPRAPPRFASEAVRVWDTSLVHAESEYGQKHVRLAVHYENLTERRVVGVLVYIAVENSFGKRVFEKTFEDEVLLAPVERQRNETYWSIQDNQFIRGEPYDLLWQLALQGTGKVTTEVRKVIFEGGEVLEGAPKRERDGAKKKR